MKYIKLFEGFENKSSDKSISDINDIFVELKDIGYTVIVDTFYNKKGIYHYIIDIRNNTKLLNCSNIKEAFYMLCDYFDCDNVLFMTKKLGTSIYTDADINTFPDNKYVRYFRIEFITMKNLPKTNRWYGENKNKMIVSFSM